MQNESFDHTIPHNKCSSLVLPTGQFPGTIQNLLGRNSLLHILITLIIKICFIKCLQPAFCCCQKIIFHLSLVSNHININWSSTRHPKFIALKWIFPNWLYRTAPGIQFLPKEHCLYFLRRKCKLHRSFS